MAIYKEDILDIELNSGSIERSFLNHTIGTGDSKANRFGVRLFRNGEPVSAESCTVTGLFMAPDGTRYVISETSFSGSTGKDGNKAWAQLPPVCYAVPGQFALAIKLTGGGVEGTMRIVDGTVSETGEEGAVVPTSTIPATADIIAAYEEAVEVIAGSVRFDASQTLSDAEAETARENIGAVSTKEIDDANIALLINSQQSMIQLSGMESGVINVLDGMVFTRNGINSSGIPVDNGHNIRTEYFIDLKDHIGVLHCIRDAESLVKNVKIFCYDDEYTFIDGTILNTGSLSVKYEGDFKLPYGTKYVKFMYGDENWGIFDDLSSAQTVKILLETSNSHKVISEFEFEYGTIRANEQSGHLIESNTRIVVNDYIAVGKGTVLECAKNDCLGYTSFDKDLKVIDTFYYAKTYTIPQDCYIRPLMRYNTSNDEIGEEEFAEMQDWLKIHYVAPTDYHISEKRLNGLDIIDDAGLKASNNILFGQMWEYDYLSGAEGANVPNRYSIRTKAFVPIPAGTEMIVFDVSKYQNIVGRVCLYDSTKTMVATKTYNCVDGSIQTFAVTVPPTAVYLRVTSSVNWAVTQMDDPTFGYDLVASVYVDDNSEDSTFSNIYGKRIDEAVSEYKSLAEPERVGYIWMSDIHLKTNHEESSYVVFPRVMKAAAEVAKRSGADFIMIGGDIIDGESNQTNVYTLLAKAFKPIRECGVPVVWLMGNHDDNAYGTVFSKSKANALFAGQSEYYNGIQTVDASDGYYYFDIPAKKKRIICLNAMDYPSGKNGSNWWSLSEKQVKWFCETAVDTPYNIIILTHMLPMLNYNFYGLGDNGGYHTDLCSAMSAYNSRGSVTLYGRTYDFTNATGTIKFIHAGHTHVEFGQELQSIQAGGVECVVTGCAKQWSQEIKADEIAVDADAGIYEVTSANQQALHYNNSGFRYYHWADRTAGEIQEALFDLVSANEDSVRCIRIGAGNSRTYTL